MNTIEENGSMLNEKHVIFLLCRESKAAYYVVSSLLNISCVFSKCFLI